MLSGEVAERQQHVAVLYQLGDRLGILRFEESGEVVDAGVGVGAGLGLEEWIELFGAGITVQSTNQVGMADAVSTFDQAGPEQRNAMKKGSLELAGRLAWETSFRDYEAGLEAAIRSRHR